MLKFLVILATLASVSFFAVTAQGYPAEGTTKDKSARVTHPQKETQSDNQDSEKTPSVIIQVGSQQPASSNTDEEKETRRVAEYTYWLMVFTAVLAAVSIVQGYFLKKHGDELHSLAGAARDNAETILKQTSHIVASERAWILIHPKETQLPSLIPIDALDLRNGPGEHTLAHCMVSLKNFGRTPAYVFSCDFQMQVGVSSGAPPDRSFYEEIVEFSEYPIAPDEFWPMQATLQPEGFVNVATLEAINQGQKFLWLCGVIRYEDVFECGGVKHETRVCMIYEARTSSPKPYWTIAGPNEYNRAT